MRDILEKIDLVYIDICSKQFEILFQDYFNDKAYIPFFKKQFYSMYKNVRSINELLKIENIEDAFSIFRKYIETYIIINSILENPNISSRYLIHELFLSYKANNQNTYELKEFYKNKPEGYLQYGFIEDLIETTSEDFKYTIRDVAKIGGILDYYEWYRLSNNFVHNNTTNLNINIIDGTKKIKELINVSMTRFINRLKEIIKMLNR